MTDSPQQTEIYSFIDSGTGHLSIRACAGSGKSTTLAGIARRTKRTQRVLAIAFGREAADSLRAKVPYHVIADTHHKFGKSLLYRHFKIKRPPEDKKCTFILADIVPNKSDRFRIRETTLKLVSLAKNNAYDCDGGLYGDSYDLGLADLAEYYGLEVTQEHLQVAHKLLDESFSRTDIVDFDDMLWLPLRHNLCFDPADFVLLDEAQDTNPCQELLLPRMLGPDGRLVIVGDPNQAIYAFRGASHGAMEKMERTFGMTVMPLSVSYRCSQEVVREAQRVLDKPLRKRTQADSRHVRMLQTPIDPDESTDPMDFFDECDALRHEQEPL